MPGNLIMLAEVAGDLYAQIEHLEPHERVSIAVTLAALALEPWPGTMRSRIFQLAADDMSAALKAGGL